METRIEKMLDIAFSLQASEVLSGENILKLFVRKKIAKRTNLMNFNLKK